MIGWIIASIITIIFLLLLFSPVYLSVSYERSWKVKIRCLFVSYPIYPPKSLQKKKKGKKHKSIPQKKQKLEEKSSVWRDILKEKGIKGLLSLLGQMTNAAAGGAKKLFRHLVIQKCFLQVTVGGEDAAQTAMEYGYLCAAVYPAVGAVIANTKCKSHNIRVLCDFDSPETDFRFYGKCSIKVLFLLAAGWTVLYRFLKSQIKEKLQVQQQSE